MSLFSLLPAAVACNVLTIYMNRVLPSASSSAPKEETPISSLNLFIIVGLALIITILARYFARRGGRKH